MLELLGAHKDSPSLDTMAVPRLKLVNRLKSAAYNALQCPTMAIWLFAFNDGGSSGLGRIEKCKECKSALPQHPPVNYTKVVWFRTTIHKKTMQELAKKSKQVRKFACFCVSVQNVAFSLASNLPFFCQI